MNIPAQKGECTGCGACANMCPSGAITMRRDREGFDYPQINKDKCTNCSICTERCPVNTVVKGMTYTQLCEKTAFAVRIKDEAIERNSSSGGVFYALGKHIIDLGGTVYGAGYDDDFKVIHKRAQDIPGLMSLMRSKYVQSAIGDIYARVRTDLEHGRQVLFTGTPCQTAGLRAFLDQDYDGLLIADIICHGVPSPGLYERYLTLLRQSGEIQNISFRDKSDGWKKNRFSVDYASGQSYCEYLVKDSFMLAFLQNISLRLSCYDCRFKGLSGGSDLTLGDCWGIENKKSSLADGRGVSLVIPITDKGAAAIDSLATTVYSERINTGEMIDFNRMLYVSVGKNPLRERFFADADKLNMKKLSNKYCGSCIGAKLRRFTARKIKGWRNV